jgi:hypothetical protein
VHEDNLGEFETRLFLYEHLQDVERAARGAGGWDGDRYQFVQTRAGAGLAWLTVWDSAIEAAEFGDLMERMVERRYGASARSGGSGDTRRWTVSGRRLMLAASVVEGRAVVVWEDLPGGAASGIIDLRQVTLREE